MWRASPQVSHKEQASHACGQLQHWPCYKQESTVNLHKLLLQMPVKALLQTVALLDPEALSEQAADGELEDGQVRTHPVASSQFKPEMIV